MFQIIGIAVLFGAVFAAQRRGMKVPDDLSIVGFNDLEFSETAFPALTTVATPRYQIGELAAKIVLEIVRGSGKRPEQRIFNVGFRLIRRESTAAPRKRAARAAGRDRAPRGHDAVLGLGTLRVLAVHRASPGASLAERRLPATFVRRRHAAGERDVAATEPPGGALLK